MTNALHHILRAVFHQTALVQGTVSTTSGTFHRVIRRKTVSPSEVQAVNHQFPGEFGVRYPVIKEPYHHHV